MKKLEDKITKKITMQLSDADKKLFEEAMKSSKESSGNKLLSLLIYISTIATGIIFIVLFPSGTIKNILLILLWIYCLFTSYAIKIISLRNKVLSAKQKINDLILTELLKDLERFKVKMESTLKTEDQKEEIKEEIV